MSSPLVRTWLAARLTDWADHGYAILRGIGYHLGISLEWDPCEIDKRYTVPLDPGPDCPCGALYGGPCIGKTGRPLRITHKERWS